MATVYYRHIQTDSTLIRITITTLAGLHVLRYQRHDVQWSPIHHVLQYIFFLSLWRILFVLLRVESWRSVLYLGCRWWYGSVALTRYILVYTAQNISEQRFIIYGPGLMRKRSISIHLWLVWFLLKMGFQRESMERLREGTHSQNDIQ